MLRIGLTGGIAAGKSTAAARFAELGARVVDHDRLARRAVEPGSAALVDIVREFGDRVIVDGQLDRKALADIVFHDDAARERLNGIVHPTVFAMGQAEDRMARRDGVHVVVHDIPLLYEAGGSGGFGLVVSVQADRGVRLKRLMDGRGMTHDEAVARIDAQASDTERASIADVVLDGSGTPEHLIAQVDALWRDRVPHSG
ncbi:dephospho-CoA kinase [Demequina capsici]|uniref:Dephospho-CoA kinase n=1 Tax=Demequina capsici TaxID=3075620 RepID=A0AA96JER4_9MICO|nr:dephospho-CoA kinase [Demequina sp. PMTSA13]WNM26039.1 dephospho-CoA kinase [Demequina sp. PMTSA13]